MPGECPMFTVARAERTRAATMFFPRGPIGYPIPPTTTTANETRFSGIVCLACLRFATFPAGAARRNLVPCLACAGSHRAHNWLSCRTGEFLSLFRALLDSYFL
jgi:hypothetical protein